MLPYKPIPPTRNWSKNHSLLWSYYLWTIIFSRWFSYLQTDISAGEAAYGIGATLHDAITANINTGFVDFSNPWYQRFIYQFDGEPKATGHAMKWQHDHKSQVTTYVRDSWPEGIRVSISTQYLAFNDKTLIDPQVKLLVELSLVHHCFIIWQAWSNLTLVGLVYYVSGVM